MKISNLLAERLIKIFYSLISLFIGARFFAKDDFLILQQIVLFQSVIVFLLNLPYSSIILRLSNNKKKYFKDIYGFVLIFRLGLAIISICSIGIYLKLSLFQTNEILLILFGQISALILIIFLTDIIPHLFNFEGKKNWQLVYINLLFLIFKVITLLVFKSIFYKSVLEIIEAFIVVIWCYNSYIGNLNKADFNFSNFIKVKKIGFLSSGLYLNGIFSVVIVRIDQLILTSQLDKINLSNYMLIGSIISLFMLPLNIYGERVSFILNKSKSKSFESFKSDSQKNLLMFFFMGLGLYLLFMILFEKISILVFNRDLDYLFVPSCILGLSIIINAIGMILGQINVVLNGGYFTLVRTSIGSLAMLFFIYWGYDVLGILGVAIASIVCLFFTNNLFWFISNKVRRILTP